MNERPVAPAEQRATADAARVSRARGGYVMPILSGLLILAAALIPWMLLSQLNARVRPDLPWAALTTVFYLLVMLAWLGGWGPPAHTAKERRRRLRLWPPHREDAGAPGMPVSTIIVVLAVMYVLWIVTGWMSPVPDLSAYPTTTYRWSMFLMGGIMAGVVEETAFRGYMQTGLERHDPQNAIWITSVVFVASHLTHGIGTVLLLGPGFFIVSVLYGTLARRTGTILPGMILHVVGDLAYVYFGALRGDGRALFAGQ